MSVDEYADLSLVQLQDLRGKIDTAIGGLANRNRGNALELLNIKAREMGFDDVFEVIGKSTRRPAEQKFVNPKLPKETWSGRGRQPLWFREAMAEGATPESLTVKREPA